MTKKSFATGFWGEMNLNSKVEKAESKEEEKPDEIDPKDVIDEDDENKDKPDKEKDEDYSDDLDEQKDKEKAKPKESESEDKSDNEGEGEPFSTEDAEKAFLMLDEEGVLELDDDEEFTPDQKGLADAVAATVRKKLQAEIAKTPEPVQALYQHLANGGDVSSFKYEESVDWSSFDLENEVNQERAFRESLRAQGLTQEEIDAEVEDVKESGKLETRAQRAIGILETSQKKAAEAKAKEVAKKEKEAQDAALKERRDMEEKLEGLDEVAGFKLNKTQKQALKDHIYKVNPRTGMTKLQENLSDKERILRIAFLDFVEYNKDDLEKDVTTKLSRQRLKQAKKYTDSKVKNAPAASVKSSDIKNKGKLIIPSLFGGKTEIED